ncbi:MAG: GNAT family N-acetyltransferase, partial [Chloroflexota bacterium]
MSVTPARAVAAANGGVGVRAMRPGDVDAALALINAYAAEDRMLERTREFLMERVGDFFVADDVATSSFQGCVALAVLTPDLAEIRSLAVRPDASGRGIGRALVAACVDEARRIGLRRVFALTLV